MNKTSSKIRVTEGISVRVKWEMGIHILKSHGKICIKRIHNNQGVAAKKKIIYEKNYVMEFLLLHEVLKKYFSNYQTKKLAL